MESRELVMNTKQEIGGVTRSILVLMRIKSTVAATGIKSSIIRIGLTALLLACTFGVSLAQMPQNDLEFGNRAAFDAFEEMSAIYGPEALHGGLLEENTLWTDGLENIEMDTHTPKGELILYSVAASSEVSAPEPPKGNIVISLFNGRGFALKGDETHILRMNMELIRDIDPVYLRDLMTSNKSIEDIEEELNSEDGTTAFRGGLRINESGYSLLNIKFVPSKDNATIIDADVAEPYLKPSHGNVMKQDTDDKIALAGHIKITVSPSVDGLIGKGDLVMRSEEYSGKYTVLLHTEKPLPTDILPAGGDLAPPN
jgi:hypothetical protein